MRNCTILLAFLALQGCSSKPQDPPSDVVGIWTADFLLNTSTAAPGPDVSPFGTLTLKAANFGEGVDTYVGGATAEFIAYAVQGTVDMPLSDANGDVLYEQVGTISYAGTWDEYTPFPDFDVSLDCQEVKINPSRPDVQAICGAPDIDLHLGVACSLSEGSETMQCGFKANVFHRQ